jgi:NADPH:quinone reductase-like Zn-dependent oxidoreductase
MRAIVITAPGGPEVLREREVPTPEPGIGEVRVRVRAVGLNRADLLQRRGHYPAPPGAPAQIPGLEYAGMVDDVGAGVTRWRPGDRVMGIVGGGAYAEAVVVHEREALPIPSNLDFDAAAAIPEAFLTAHDALFTLLGLTSGEDLLVHAIGSGVGLAALQLAHAAGARVIGTSRSAWKLQRALELGLDSAIDTGEAAGESAGGSGRAVGSPEAVGGGAGSVGGEVQPSGSATGGKGGKGFDDVVLRETGGAGVAAVLDLVGGAYLAGNLRALASRGRVVVVGLVAGRSAELDLGLLLSKRLTLIGTVLRSRSLEEKVAVAEAFRANALPLFEEGRLRPVVDRVFSFDEVGAAQAYMEENRNFGKVVLRWES